MAFVIDVQINVITIISNPLMPTSMGPMECYEKIFAPSFAGQGKYFFIDPSYFLSQARNPTPWISI